MLTYGSFHEELDGLISEQDKAIAATEADLAKALERNTAAKAARTVMFENTDRASIPKKHWWLRELRASSDAEDLASSKMAAPKPQDGVPTNADSGELQTPASDVPTASGAMSENANVDGAGTDETFVHDSTLTPDDHVPPPRDLPKAMN